MTVQEMIEQLQEYNPDWLVVIDGEENFTIDFDTDNEEIIIELGD